jgi:hypothetical protein
MSFPVSQVPKSLLDHSPPPLSGKSGQDFQFLFYDDINKVLEIVGSFTLRFQEEGETKTTEIINEKNEVQASIGSRLLYWTTKVRMNSLASLCCPVAASREWRSLVLTITTTSTRSYRDGRVCKIKAISNSTGSTGS